MFVSIWTNIIGQNIKQGLKRKNTDWLSFDCDNIIYYSCLSNNIFNWISKIINLYEYQIHYQIINKLTIIDNW